MKKNGFTLIELLAVIVIVGVLSLIATPVILGVIESARRGAAVNSTYGYVEAIEKSSLQDMIDKSEYITKKDGTYSAETIKPVKYKGNDPVDVCVTIQNGEVYSGSFQFGKYVVDYEDGKAAINDEKENAGCGGNSENPEEKPKDSDDLKEDTKVKNGENYYIGANPKNWVLFGRADESDSSSLLMWRIIKIDKNGIKMVYEGIQNGENVPLEDGRALLNGTMGVAWNSNGTNLWNESDLKEKLTSWLSRIAVVDMSKYVESTTWNIGGIPDLNPTTLRTFLEYGNIDSNGLGGTYQGITDTKSPIGMISPWDYMYTSSNEECSKSYVSAGTSNECSLDSEGRLNNFLYKNKYSYWTMNAVNSASDQAWNITNSGIIASRQVNYSIYSVRPVLNLKLDTKFVTGDGSIENPYIVEDYLANLFVKPEIKLNGEKTVVLYQGEQYVDAGATAYDEQDGDISNKITTESNLDVNKVGSYTITYNVTDSDGNKAIPVTRIVKVVEKDTPRITLNGENPSYITVGNTYTELGAKAMDPNYGDISSSIVINGIVDTNTLGTYYLTYHVTNQDGLEAIPVERRVVVKASTPKITLNGSSLALVEVGASYMEEGAIASDSVEGDLTDRIRITGNVDTSMVGIYQIRYSVTNFYGANAYVDRRINVVGVAGPEITYTPNEEESAKVGQSTTIEVKKKSYDIDSKTLKYFTYNKVSGALPSYETIEEFERLFRTSYKDREILKIGKGTGEYYFYAMAKDVYKDTTYKESGLFRLDNFAPIITLNTGANRILINSTYIDPGATAYDAYFDGDLTNQITVQNKVNTSKEGIYQVIYKVSDSVGNETKKVRNIEVYHSVPTIGLIGGSKIKVRYGSSYIDPGYTAMDEIDGDLTSQVKVTGTVDTSREGSYEVIYQVKNSLGYETTKTRIVEVYIPSPVITIRGANPAKVRVTSTYNDAGATALDEIDGDLTNKITVISNINTMVEGTYEVVYHVTNSLGKTTTATRIVQTYAEMPVITLKGDNPTILYKGATYTEAGAIATDPVEGDISSNITISGIVDTKKAGNYIITYEVTNSYGKKVKIERSVIVRASAIRIALKGESIVTLLRGTQYVEAGYSAVDEIDGDITSSIVIDLGGLNINKAGTYTITYTATNPSGDKATVKRTIIIRDPKVEITLNGNSVVEVPIGYPYSDLGATAMDELLGDVSSTITVEHNINTNVLGIYQVTYRVVSSGVIATKERTVKVVALSGPTVTFETNGNGSYLKENQTKVTVSKNNYDFVVDSIFYQWTTSLSRPSESSFQTHFASGDIVKTPEQATGKYYLWILAKDTYGNTTVVPSNAFHLDNTAPVLTLKGKNLIEVPADGTYQDPGVTVVENDSGLDSNGVVITSNVISGVIGTYQVVYTATDKVGNVAEPVKRTVSIIEARLQDAPGEGYVKKYDTSYFVGENPNNYVVFGNAATNDYDYIPILWRIIKADDNGIKIIYEGVKQGTGTKENGTIGSSSYDSTNNNYNRPADIISILNNFYNNLKEEDKASLTKAINWCVGATSSPYNIDAFRTDECNTLSTNKSVIGLVSGLDYLFTTGSACDAYNQASCGNQNFLKKSYNYFTMSSDIESQVSQFIANSNGALTRTEVTSKQEIRPVINLRPDVLIKGGEGTYEKPYQLNNRVPVEDTKAPTVKFSPNEATGNLDGVEVLVSDDITGVDNNSLKYVWTTNTTQPSVDKFVNNFSNGDKVLVPTEQSATYYLWILAKDRKGNQSITRSGLYKIDNVPPVITIKGDNPYSQKPGLTYVDAGATAVDAIDGAVSVQTTTNVNPNIEGTYQVTYTAVDKTGNKATAVRTVVIGYLEIRTPEDFYNIRNNTKADYKVMNDIDMSKSEWKDNFPVIPEFSGTIEGNNKKIIGLKISGNGIFTKLNVGAEIRNIKLVGFENNSTTLNNVGSITGYLNNDLTISGVSLDSTSKITGQENVGGLVGNVATGILTIKNTTNEGAISGRGSVGGIAGTVTATINIENSSSSGTITGTGDSTGGLIGSASTATIKNSNTSSKIVGKERAGGLAGGVASLTLTNSFATGEITGTNNVGRLLGFVRSGTITDCYAPGNLTATGNNVGGISGYVENVTINNSYITGNISGVDSVGGLVGNTTGSVTVNNSYTSGKVSGTNSIGGLVGSVTATGTITNSYTTGEITGTGISVGGLLGSGNTTNITESYTTGNIKGQYNIGGLLGVTSKGTINKGYVSGTIESTQTKSGAPQGNGGIVGQIYNGSISNTYVVGEVKANGGYSGGLIGFNYYASTTNSYVLGKLTKTNAIIGYSLTGVSNTYWISETTGVYSSSYGSMINSVPEAVQRGSYSGFDFDTIWNIEDGSTTPYLRGMMIPDKNYLENIEHYEGEGRGTPTDPYLIRTAKDFYNIRISPNSYYKVMNNIDIGTSVYKDNFPQIQDFLGTLDGNNKKITGLKVTGTGLFGTMYSGASIKNLEFVTMIVDGSGQNNVGGITGTINNVNITLDNVKIDSTSEIKGNQNVGGFIGTLNKEITMNSILSEAKITATSNNVGGIIGYLTANLTLDSTKNKGVITTTGDYVGGLVGNVATGILTIKNTTNEGAISGRGSVGGIAGTVTATINIENSSSSGTITGTGDSTGGLIGSASTATIKNSNTSSKIVGKERAGGLAGGVASLTLTNSFATGEITGTNNVGRLLGFVRSGTITDCYAPGNLTATGNNVGGISGYVENVTINDSYITGNISGVDSVGGLVGNATGSVTVNNSYTSGKISGNTSIGGLVGSVTATGTITNSYTTGEITGTGISIGGLLGSGNTTNITGSYTTGNIKGQYNIGGLLGVTSKGTINKGYVSGTIESTQTKSGAPQGNGGIVGQIYNGSISNTYVVGEVKANGGYSGGLIGFNYYASTTNSYVLGKLTKTNAIIGYSLTGVSNTYWISETTGVYSSSYGSMINSVPEAVQRGSYSGFDFDTIWNIEDGSTTPYLRGMTIPSQVYIGE